MSDKFARFEVFGKLIDDDFAKLFTSVTTKESTISPDRSDLSLARKNSLTSMTRKDIDHGEWSHDEDTNRNVTRRDVDKDEWSHNENTTETKSVPFSVI